MTIIAYLTLALAKGIGLALALPPIVRAYRRDTCAVIN